MKRMLVVLFAMHGYCAAAEESNAHKKLDKRALQKIVYFCLVLREGVKHIGTGEDLSAHDPRRDELKKELGERAWHIVEQNRSK